MLLLFPAPRGFGYSLEKNMDHNEQPAKRRYSKWWLLPLVLPYIALCFPQIYARATPQLFGFPFFYWYQLAWVVLASTIMGVVYSKIKSE
jgi:hypothetical protein